MRILIYGAGVIGSLYAARFAAAGYEVALYARGSRLACLREKGLLYRWRGKICKAPVAILDTLADDNCYDFIFLTVRAEQATPALEALRANRSSTIVTMVNQSGGYAHWEAIVGKGRILPAFPGAGGSLDDGVLDAGFAPRIIQPTTFGEVDGVCRERTQALRLVFRKCHIPCQIVPCMQNWQLSHLGMVVPIANAYYQSSDPAHVWREKAIMRRTAQTMKSNFHALAARSVLCPFKFHLLRFCPLPIFTLGLTLIFRSAFGDRFMYRHAIKSPEEMHRLHQELEAYLSSVPCT